MTKSNLISITSNLIRNNLFFFLILILSSSFAQDNSFKEKLNITYSIQNIESVKNSAAYVDAMNSANFNYHRLKSERNILEFEGGVKIVLFSAEEVLGNGVTTIVPNSFPVKIENYYPPLFRLADNNYIIELKQIIPIKG